MTAIPTEGFHALRGEQRRPLGHGWEQGYSFIAPPVIPDAQVYVAQTARRGHKATATPAPGRPGAAGGVAVPITTIMISGIPLHFTREGVMRQLDACGLSGTYNFFYMPKDARVPGGRIAFVNFIDPNFASLCQWLASQCQLGTASPAHIQGLENNLAYFVDVDDATELPVLIPTPIPSREATAHMEAMPRAAQTPGARHVREQFRKTRMCMFHLKKKCALGADCPFAHDQKELQAAPDLFKTKLCCNFFRKKCADPMCRFAHGYKELRSTETVYKTELCKWWESGVCNVGDTCRHAHGVEELRGPQAGTRMPRASQREPPSLRASPPKTRPTPAPAPSARLWLDSQSTQSWPEAGEQAASSNLPDPMVLAEAGEWEQHTAAAVGRQVPPGVSFDWSSGDGQANIRATSMASVLHGNTKTGTEWEGASSDSDLLATAGLWDRCAAAEVGRELPLGLPSGWSPGVDQATAKTSLGAEVASTEHAMQEMMERREMYAAAEVGQKSPSLFYDWSAGLDQVSTGASTRASDSRSHTLTSLLSEVGPSEPAVMAENGEWERHAGAVVEPELLPAVPVGLSAGVDQASTRGSSTAGASLSRPQTSQEYAPSDSAVHADMGKWERHAAAKVAPELPSVVPFGLCSGVDWASIRGSSAAFASLGHSKTSQEGNGAPSEPAALAVDGDSQPSLAAEVAPEARPGEEDSACFRANSTTSVFLSRAKTSQEAEPTASESPFPAGIGQ